MNNKVHEENLARSFAKLMMKGKATSAMRLVSGEKAGAQKLGDLTEQKKIQKNGIEYIHHEILHELKDKLLASRKISKSAV